MDTAENISRAYLNAPVLAHDAIPAYMLLEDYIADRYAMAVEKGFIFVRSSSDKPPDLAKMRKERKLLVYDEHHDHPFWANETNWRFRAIHDVIGHWEHGITFPGERRAFKAQAKDFTAWAKGSRLTHSGCCALFTEIVGQAAHYRVHHYFPQQKAAMLWEQYVNEKPQRDHPKQRKQSRKASGPHQHHRGSGSEILLGE